MVWALVISVLEAVAVYMVVVLLLEELVMVMAAVVAVVVVVLDMGILTQQGG